MRGLDAGWVVSSVPRIDRPWQLDHGLVGIRPVEQHGVAEYLRDVAARACGECVGGFVAIEPGGFADLDLDELVVGERLLDRGYDAVVDAALAELHDGAKLVTEPAEMTALLSGEHTAL